MYIYIYSSKISVWDIEISIYIEISISIHCLYNQNVRFLLKHFMFQWSTHYKCISIYDLNKLNFTFGTVLEDIKIFIVLRSSK